MKLAKYLSEYEIPQDEFADVAGISQSMVSKLIRGVRNAGVTTALKIEHISHGKVRAEDLPLSREDRGTMKVIRRMVRMG